MTSTVAPTDQHSMVGVLSQPSEPTSKEKLKRFAKKYFLEGQKFTNEEKREPVIPPDADSLQRFTLKHRKLLAFVIPPAFMWTWWWMYAIGNNIFPLYATRFSMPITMFFGAFIGGMTCEGGGAVAFPVMTLFLHINPTVARDFALMIQSCGMTSAAFTILYMGVALEWHSIVFCTIGATIGIIFGIEVVDPAMSKEQKKMFFVSIWSAFACALFLLNTQRKRRTYLTIQMFCWWKGLILLLTGFFGGILTSFAGTGVCICSFSVLTLVFSINEKIATQTSILLIASNAMTGFFWRAKIIHGISELAWEYWKCTVPVVVVMGPLGAFVGSHVHRQTLAWAVYILEAIALVSGFVIVKPSLILSLVCVGIIVGGFFFFFILSRVGRYLLSTYPDAKKPTTALPTNNSNCCNDVAS
uniref:Uncharacterized protein n=2 Tax=Plectus sambesii TaxID=2011161 RepID=A0A914W5K1_9BILA